MTTSPILLPDNASRPHPAGHSGTSAPRRHLDLSKLTRATAEQAGSRNELAWLLVLDNLIDAGEAETRWLDQVGTRLVRRAARAPSAFTRDTAGSLARQPGSGDQRPGSLDQRPTSLDQRPTESAAR